MNFIKTFLAGLLAVVVGTFLVFFLWIFILLGIAGSMEKSVAVHPESILKIDFSEVLTDAPSSDPLAGLDLMTLQTQRQLPLLKALRALEAARDDDRIKGIYLRMNGTGGVTGSAILEELREALVEFKQSGKFIVAYNETYSQGGYYLASVADKMTLTGSIGVFGMFLDTRDALKNKLGITVDGVKSNASADFAATSPLTPLQRAMIMRGVDRVYTTFTNHVAEGRNLPIGKVLDIAGGRVWLGKDALEVGLIDTYGGLKTAIALAVDKAELGDGYRVVEVKEEPTGFAAIIASLNVSVREAFARSELGLMMKEYNTVREALNQQGVLMYSPWKVEVR